MKELNEVLQDWEAVIGLEIHTELTALDTKMFCNCKLTHDDEPNTHVCPVCLGLPGALPVPNKRAIESIVKAGLATNCEIQKHSMFYRKHYFYPDMAKNFQTTQGPVAFCMHGHLDLEVTGRGAEERPACAFGEAEAASLASASAGAVGLSADLSRMAGEKAEGASDEGALAGLSSYDTAALAERAGAKVLIHNDADPAHHMAAYPLRYGIDHILSIEDDPYEIIIRVDADNHLNAEYSSLMNDAYQSGVDLARPYEGAKNAAQNFFTKACTMFYVFESRYGSRVRERLGLAAHVNGSGAMMSARMLKATGGYDCVTISEDAEYYFNRLLDGYKGHFVEDAVVSEDMPSSLKDTYNRNKRIGSGSVSLLKPKFSKLLKKFFATGDLSCLEICMTYSFLFFTVLLCVWFPLYYIYHFTYLAFAAYGGMQLTLFTAAWCQSLLWNTLIVGGSILIGLFVFFGYVQALFLVITDYKKIGAKKRSELIGAVLWFPFFLIVYSVTICMGTISKPTWGKAKRNTK